METPKILYGQIIVGPPSSGKSTYVIKMKQYLETLKRKVVIINLDPANEKILYKIDIDIKELINVNDVMEINKNGPNASLIYCIDMLNYNIEWLIKRLEKYRMLDSYYLFDCPGQIELFTHNESLRNIVKYLCNRTNNFSLTTVYLIDIRYCCDPLNFLSSVMQSLNSMMHLELPHINAISKFDLLPKYENDLNFNINYYLENNDLERLIDFSYENNDEKIKKFFSKISQVINDYALISFVSLCSFDVKTLFNILVKIDQANGFIYSQQNKLQNKL